MPARITCPECGERQVVEDDPHGRRPRCVNCGYAFRRGDIAAGQPPRPPRRRDEEPILLEPAEEDYADEPDLREPVELPRKVMTAGIVWIIFGILILINFLLQIVLVSQERELGPGGTVGVGVCLGIFGALLGGGFIFVGVQNVRGTAPGVIGNGVGSIILAVLMILGSLVQAARGGHLLVAVINIGLAMGLVVAGVLVLVSGAEYTAYRRATKPRRRESHRRRGPRDD
jgi:uncharacterized integral membrane protein